MQIRSRGALLRIHLASWQPTVDTTCVVGQQGTSLNIVNEFSKIKHYTYIWAGSKCNEQWRYLIPSNEAIYWIPGYLLALDSVLHCIIWTQVVRCYCELKHRPLRQSWIWLLVLAGSIHSISSNTRRGNGTRHPATATQPCCSDWQPMHYVVTLYNNIHSDICYFQISWK